jgi:hypothetical protein
MSHIEIILDACEGTFNEKNWLKVWKQKDFSSLASK